METIAISNTNQSIASAATIGAVFGIISVCSLIFFILYVIASWKIFKKAGEPGWKAIIPIYNLYIMYKIVGMKSWFWFLLIFGLFVGIISTLDGTANFFTTEVQPLDFNAHPISTTATLIYAILSICISILYSWRLSKIFGHGVGYFIGLIFLPNIFWLILGFGKSKYNKKHLHA